MTFVGQWFSWRSCSACSLDGSFSLTQFLPQLFNFLRQSLNNSFVSAVRQRFAADGTMENQLYGFFKRDSLAFWCITIIKIMVFFIVQPNIQFFKNSSFLA